MAVDLDALVDEALDTVGGKQTEASKWLVERAKGDREIRDAMFTEARLQIIAYRLVYDQISEIREAAWDHEPTKPILVDSDARFQQVTAKRLSDFILADGQRLGDATKTQLMVTSERDRKQGRTLLWRAVWLRAIADRMPNDNVTVAEVFEDSELETLQNNTQPE